MNSVDLDMRIHVTVPSLCIETIRSQQYTFQRRSPVPRMNGQVNVT